MKLSFDVCAFVALLVLCGAGAIADPVDPAGDQARALHKELAGTRGNDTPSIRDTKPITFKVTTDSPSALMFAKPCTGGHANDAYLTVNDGNGHPIVTINGCTGKVTIAHPERMNAQAVEFWRTLQKAFPQVCRVDIAGAGHKANVRGTVNKDAYLQLERDGGITIKGADSK